MIAVSIYDYVSSKQGNIQKRSLLTPKTLANREPMSK
jgi:hypothetical protein